MPVVLICPQGHQWEPPAGSGAATIGAEVPCPVCGTIVRAVGDDDSPADSLSPTLDYSINDGCEAAGPTAKADSTAENTAAVVNRRLQRQVAEISKAADDKALPTVPGFAIERELGRGGMGVVYLAQQDGLDRRVALKMILAGKHAGEEDMARFRAEATAISRLQHPNMVQIYDWGEHDGRPYFALEYVDGGSLWDRLKGKPLPPGDGARLAETLARALHFAHQRGIVHRDVKPANVLLTADGTPKVTDFGLAKRMDSGVAHTHTGSIMGTPSYMAPEQAAGNSKRVGPHTDVYALGSMLYEFLTGRPPFVAESGWDTIVQVMNQEPVPPRRLNPKVPRDLDTICLKCLQKEPAKRYASALSLAEDLGRFLAGEPIHARPTGRAERLWKWVKRRPAAAGLIALSAAAAVALLAGGYAYHRQVQRYAERNRRSLVQIDISTGVRALDDGEWFGALVWFAEALDKDRDDAERAEYHRRRFASVLRQCPKLVQLWFHEGGVRHASFSPDGRRAVTAGVDQVAQGWDVASGAAVGTPLRHDGAVVQAWFNPDGGRVLTASEDGTARVWEADTGRPITPPLRHGRALVSAAFSPDGRQIITAAETEDAILWDVADGRRLDPPLRHGAAVHYAAFSPDGLQVITAGADGTAKIWDAATHKVARPALTHAGPVRFAAFSPDSRLVVTTSSDYTARLWRADTGAAVVPPLRHRDAVKWAAFSPDGRRLLTASDDDTAKVWDVATGRLLVPPMRHGSDVRRYATFSPNGCLAVTAGDDNSARVWDTYTGEPFTTKLVHNGTVRAVAFSPDGHHIISASDDNTARLWDIATGSLLVARADRGSISRPTVDEGRSPDGRRAVRIDGSKAEIYDPKTGLAMGSRLTHRRRINRAAFSADGRFVVTASDDQTARVWDATTGAAVSPPLRHASVVYSARFSPDGDRVITASGDNTARIWDTRTGELMAPPLHHCGTVEAAVFSPDGRLAATASRDQTARVWNAFTGNAVTVALRHPHEVRDVAFQPDGRQLTTVTSIGTVRDWELPTDDRPLADLMLTAQLLSGNRISARGGYWPLDVAEMRAAWDELKGKHPDAFRSLPHEVRDWHRRAADECEANRQWPAAVWHLDRLIGTDPGSAVLWARRGYAQTQLGNWRAATADFARAVKKAPQR